jgi:predicted dehydrogenase
MRILVVGLGSMGRRRLRNLRHIGGVELAAYEPSHQRRIEAAREFDIPILSSFQDGLEWGPGALVISTPPDRHAQYALQAAEAGIAFFTEASVVTDGMEEVLAAVRASGSLGAPSCTMRFHPAVQSMRRRLGEGAIGRPLAFTHHVGQYLPDWHPWEDYRSFYGARRETGAAREIVPFELNWLTYLFGAVVQLGCFRGKLSDLEADIDDIYSSLLGFASGVHGSMVIEVISRPPIRRARIIGEQGTLEWDWGAHCVREWRAAEKEWREHPDPPLVQGPGGDWVAENMYIEEMRGFLRAIEEGPEHWPLSLEDDHALLGTLMDLERSSMHARQELAAGEPR